MPGVRRSTRPPPRLTSTSVVVRRSFETKLATARAMNGTTVTTVVVATAVSRDMGVVRHLYSSLRKRSVALFELTTKRVLPASSFTRT
jgi:hypothetical protein